MPRPFLLIAIFCLCVSGAQARNSSGNNEEAASKSDRKQEATRRALFRTGSSSRLFSSTPKKPAASKTAPARPTPEPSRIAKAAATVKPRTIAPVASVVAPRIAPRTLPSPTVRRGLELQPTSFTPYDAYLGTVRSVIANLDARGSSMITACDLLREGRRFRYQVTDPYRAQTPAVTEARRAGDCKSKALWLYDHLGDSGAFYTIGKLERRSRTSHAWVYWRCDGRWWILDPTDGAAPIAADSVSSNRYVPYYSYSSSGTYRHPATSHMLAMGNGIPATPAVAGRGSSAGSRR